MDKFDDFEIKIHPETIEWAFKNNHINEYCFWLLLKCYDNFCGGTGKIKKELAINILKKIYNISLSSVYSGLKLGDNTYWHSYKEELYIHGYKQLIKNNNLIINKYIYMMPIKYLFNTCSKERKTLMFGIIISGNSNPQSYINVAKRCNISRKTAINYVKDCNILSKAKNYSLVKSFKNNRDLNEYLKTIGVANNEHITFDDSGIHVLKQMPNSYKIALSRVKSNNKDRKALGATATAATEKIYSYEDITKTDYRYMGVAKIKSYYSDWSSYSNPQNVRIWKEGEKE